MGGVGTYNNAPQRFEVPEKKTRICVAGYKMSNHTGRARRIAALIARKYPNDYETWFYFDGASCYYHFLQVTFDPVPFPDHLKGHASSPFVWLETGNLDIKPIGGRSHLAEWAIKTFSNDEEIVACASKTWSFGDIFHNCCGAEEQTALVSITDKKK